MRANIGADHTSVMAYDMAFTTRLQTGAARGISTPELRAAAVQTARWELRHARNLRTIRVDLCRNAAARYGDGGALISGCESYLWPIALQDVLRANAREIAATMDRAFAAWRTAGRRRHTLIRLADAYRVDGCRY